MSDKRRLDLDILRSWLCTAVLLVHVFGHIIPQYAYVGMEEYHFSTLLAVLNRWINLTVPGFIFLSGYLVFYGRTDFSPRRFLLSRMRSTLPLYAVFSGVYFLLFYRAEGLKGFVFRLFSGDACYQLYFVPIIVQLYLLTPMLARFTRRWPRQSLFAAALLSLGFSVANILFYPALAGYYWCLPYLFYYLWGMVAGIGPEKNSSPRWRRSLLGAYLLLACFEGVMVHWAAYRAVFWLPKPWNSFLLEAMGYAKNITGLLWLRQFCRCLAARLEPLSRLGYAFTWAAGLSYPIYLAHPLLLGLLTRFIVRDSWRLLLIFPPLVWISAWIYSKCLEAFRSWLQRGRGTELPM